MGASVAGLATACRLCQHDRRVTVLERRPDLLEGGRAILLQPNGLEALERLGALELVRERGLELSRVVFFRERGRIAAVYDYGELRHPHPYAVEIRPGDLRSALGDRLAELGGAPPLLGSELVGLLRENEAVVGVRYRDNEGREHDLEAGHTIGADGPGSTVREALGIRCRRLGEPVDYVLGTPALPARSRELAVHCGPGYADGVVPLRDGTYFWDCVTAENRVAVEAGDLDGWREVFARRLPAAAELPRAVTSWDEVTLVRVRPFWARDVIADGAALAGDAAGAVHPHSAQGANLALEDAVALGDALAGGALEHYARSRQRRRRRYVLWSLLAAGSLDAPSRAWRAVRASGFAWNRVGPMRRQLLRRQAGLS